MRLTRLMGLRGPAAPATELIGRTKGPGGSLLVRLIGFMRPMWPAGPLGLIGSRGLMGPAETIEPKWLIGIIALKEGHEAHQGHKACGGHRAHRAHKIHRAPTASRAMDLIGLMNPWCHKGL